MTKLRIIAQIGFSVLALGFVLISLPTKAKALEIGKQDKRGEIKISPSQTIEDNFLATAPQVKIEGKIAGDLVVIANQADIGGEIEGNLLVLAPKVSLRGKVSKDVYLVSQNLTLSQNLEVQKDFYGATWEPLANLGAKINGKFQVSTWKISPKATVGSIISQKIVGLVSAFILGWFLLWLTPSLTIKARDNMSKHMGKSLLVGMASIFLLSLGILFSIITVLGLPLAILLAGFLWFSIYSAWIWASLALGKYLTGDRYNQAFKLFLGLLVLKLIALTPGVGPLLGIMIIFVGTGSLVLTFSEIRKTL